MAEKLIAAPQLQSQNVADSLAEKIRNGELRDGDRLASETAMSKEYGVARGTMRSALSILKEQHLIVTKPGVGSFISYHGHAMGSQWGWQQASAEAGSPTSTKLISIQRIPVPDRIHLLFRLEGDMYRITRQRLNGNNEPVSIEVSYLPATHEVASIIDEQGLLENSISRTMQKAHLIPVSGTQDATVSGTPKKYAKYLPKKEKNFLEVRRASFDDDGQLVEYVVSYLDPHHFSLHVEYRKENE